MKQQQQNISLALEDVQEGTERHCWVGVVSPGLHDRYFQQTKEFLALFPHTQNPETNKQTNKKKTTTLFFDDLIFSATLLI